VPGPHSAQELESMMLRQRAIAASSTRFDPRLWPKHPRGVVAEQRGQDAQELQRRWSRLLMQGVRGAFLV